MRAGGRAPLLVSTAILGIAGAPDASEAARAADVFSGRASVGFVVREDRWRVDERLRCGLDGLRVDVLAERDPGELLWADRLACGASLETRRCLAVAGDLRVRVPGRVFAPGGPDGSADLLAVPAPACIGAWRSSAEYGALRGAGMVVTGRRASAAIVAGSTALDARTSEDSLLRLSRDGDHAKGSGVVRGAAREDAVLASLWLGSPRQGVAASILGVRAHPAFAPAFGEPRRGGRGGLAFVRRSKVGAAWVSASSGLGSWDMAAGATRASRTLFLATGAGVSGGSGPRAARRPASPGGRDGGVEAAQTVSWEATRRIRVRARAEVRIEREGRARRTASAEALWRGDTGVESSVLFESRPSTRRVRVEWRRALDRGLAVSLAVTQGEGGATVSGVSLERTRGAHAWSVALKSASETGAVGGGLLAPSRGGASAAARVAWQAREWSLEARGASRWSGSARSAAVSLSIERRWGAAGRDTI